MNRKPLLITAAIGLVIALLIALNLSSRESDEAVVASSDRSPESARPESGDGHDAAPAASEEHGEEASAEREDERAASTDGDGADSVEAPVGCDHPLIAAERRHTRVYRWTQTDQDRVAELTLRPRETDVMATGERRVRWAIRVRATDDDSSLATGELITRCVPGQDAEEPWFGIMERALGLELVEGPGRWRWPAALREGDAFDGRASFDPREAEMRRPDDAVGPQLLHITRRHRVMASERVEVPAGSFRAWRVEFSERHAFGPRSEDGSGTLWVADGIGLVRSEMENSRGVRQTMELIRGTR